jgi:hypothetical protein
MVTGSKDVARINNKRTKQDDEASENQLTNSMFTETSILFAVHSYSHGKEIPFL